MPIAAYRHADAPCNPEGRNLNCGGLHPQRLRIPRHLQIPAPNPLAVAAQKVAQALPVNRAGRLAAVEFLVVDDGFDGVEICGGANDPFDRVGGLGERASSY